MTLFQRFKRLTLWNKLGVIGSIAGILALPIALITLPIFERQKPRPHFTLSLQTGNSPKTIVRLTNDFLFKGNITNKGSLPNGYFVYENFVNGCYVVPVQSDQSNQIFSFIAENDSPVIVNDLEVAIGFPKDWKCGLDSEKWHELAGHHFIISGWEFESTNLQFWSAQSPWPLFPSDTLTFPPITNFSIPLSNNPTNKNGLFQLSVRSTGFQTLISANVLFVRVSSNSFKPFVSALERGKDGLWRLSISEKTLEDLQK